jgi:hypothetical protein
MDPTDAIELADLVVERMGSDEMDAARKVAEAASLFVRHHLYRPPDIIPTTYGSVMDVCILCGFMGEDDTHRATCAAGRLESAVREWEAVKGG